MESSMRSNAVSIALVLDVARRQGVDVLAVEAVHSGLPRWGRRSTTWALLTDRRGYRVTSHHGDDCEFDQGYYIESLEDARRRYDQCVARERLDAEIYGMPDDVSPAR